MSEWILRSFPPNDSISLKDFFGWTNRSVFALILMAHIISLCTGECIFQNLNQQQLLTIHRHVATWRIRTGDRGLSTHASSAHSLTGAALVRPHLMTDCIQPWKDDRVMPKYAAPSCSFTLSFSLLSREACECDCCNKNHPPSVFQALSDCWVQSEKKLKILIGG